MGSALCYSKKKNHGTPSGRVEKSAELASQKKRNIYTIFYQKYYKKEQSGFILEQKGRGSSDFILNQCELYQQKDEMKKTIKQVFSKIQSNIHTLRIFLRQFNIEEYEEYYSKEDLYSLLRDEISKLDNLKSLTILIYPGKGNLQYEKSPILSHDRTITTLLGSTNNLKNLGVLSLTIARSLNFSYYIEFINKTLSLIFENCPMIYDLTIDIFGSFLYKSAQDLQEMEQILSHVYILKIYAGKKFYETTKKKLRRLVEYPNQENHTLFKS